MWTDHHKSMHSVQREPMTSTTACCTSTCWDHFFVLTVLWLLQSGLVQDEPTGFKYHCNYTSKSRLICRLNQVISCQVKLSCNMDRLFTNMKSFSPNSHSFSLCFSWFSCSWLGCNTGSHLAETIGLVQDIIVEIYWTYTGINENRHMPVTAGEIEVCVWFALMASLLLSVRSSVKPAWRDLEGLLNHRKNFSSPTSYDRFLWKTQRKKREASSTHTRHTQMS